MYGIVSNMKINTCDTFKNETFSASGQYNYLDIKTLLKPVSENFSGNVKKIKTAFKIIIIIIITSTYCSKVRVSTCTYNSKGSCWCLNTLVENGWEKRKLQAN